MIRYSSSEAKAKVSSINHSFACFWSLFLQELQLNVLAKSSLIKACMDLQINEIIISWSQWFCSRGENYASFWDGNFSSWILTKIIYRCIYASSCFVLSCEHNNFASVETGTLYQKIMVGFLLLFIHKNHLIKLISNKIFHYILLSSFFYSNWHNYIFHSKIKLEF